MRNILHIKSVIFFLLIFSLFGFVVADSDTNCLAPYSGAEKMVSAVVRQRHQSSRSRQLPVAVKTVRVVHVYITNHSSSFYGNQSKVFKVARGLAEKLGPEFHVYLVASDDSEYTNLSFFASQAKGIKNLSFTAVGAMYINEKLAKPEHIVAVGDIPFVPALHSPVMDLSELKSYEWIAIFGTDDAMAQGLVKTANFELNDKLPAGVKVNYVKTGFYSGSEGIISEKIDRAELEKSIFCSAQELEKSKYKSILDMFNTSSPKDLARTLKSNSGVLESMSQRPWALTYIRGDPLDIDTRSVFYNVSGMPAYLHELFVHSEAADKRFFMPLLLHNAVRREPDKHFGVLDAFQRALMDYCEKSSKPQKLMLWNPYKDNKSLRKLTSRFRVRAEASSNKFFREKSEFESTVQRRLNSPVYTTLYENSEIVVVHGDIPAKLMQSLDDYNVVFLQPAVLSYDSICQLLNISAHRDSDKNLTQPPVLGTGDNFFSEGLLRGIPVMHDGNLGAHHFQVPFGLFEIMFDFAHLNFPEHAKSLNAKISLFQDISSYIARPAGLKFLDSTKDRFAQLLKDGEFSRFMLAFARYLDKFDAVETVRGRVHKNSDVSTALAVCA